MELISRRRIILTQVLGLLKETFSEWRRDNAARLGAALAFYSVFSLAPLLIIVISISGLVFGQDAVQGRVVEQIGGLVGSDAARSIEAIIRNARKPASGIIAGTAGILTLLLGAAGVFGQLQDALNVIWNVPPSPGRTVAVLFRDRFLSFALVLGSGFLLLVSLVVSAGLAALNDSIARLAPVSGQFLEVAHVLVSFAVIALLFAMIFKVLPDARIAWSDVWVGAAITSLLFTIGKLLIGVYLGKSTIMSTYGAAASIVIMLVWVYYSAQVLFLGAEFTQVYANRFGSRISFAEDQSRNPVPLTVRQRGLRTAGLAGSNYVDETVTPRVAVKGSEV
jgi:membrane protein